MSYHNQKYKNYLLDEIKFNKKAFHKKFKNNRSVKTSSVYEISSATASPSSSSSSLSSSSIINNLKKNYLIVIKKLNPRIYTQILLNQEVEQFKSKLRAVTREYKLKFGFVPKSFDICEELLIIFGFLINEKKKIIIDIEEEEAIEYQFKEIMNSANSEYEILKKLNNNDNVIYSTQKNLLEEIICIFDKIKQFRLERRKEIYKRRNSYSKY